MKLLKLICILFLIVSQSFLTLQVELRESKARFDSKATLRRNKNKKAFSKAKISAKIRDTLKVSYEMDTPENLLDFILGVMAAFNSESEVLFKHKDLVKDIINPCADLKKFKAEKVNVKTSPPSVSSLWEKMEAPEKLKYCESRKKTFLDNSQRTIGWLFDECVVNKEEFQKISYKFPSIYGPEEYLKECTYFKEMKCEMFKDGVDALSFIGTAMSYAGPIKVTLACIMDLKTEILAIKEFAELADSFEQGGALYVLEKVGGVALQLITVGIWGLIKGTINLIKLSQKIYDFATTKEVKFKSYMLGKITGEAINLGKSILLGSRRKRKTRANQKYN